MEIRLVYIKAILKESMHPGVSARDSKADPQRSTHQPVHMSALILSRSGEAYPRQRANPSYYEMLEPSVTRLGPNQI